MECEPFHVLHITMKWLAEGHTIGWVGTRICTPAWLTSKLMNYPLYGTERPAVNVKWWYLAHTWKLLGLLKYEISKASHSRWILCVGPWKLGTCFWKSTWYIPHTLWLKLPRNTWLVISSHTDTLGNTLDLLSLLQIPLLPNSETATKCSLHS